MEKGEEDGKGEELYVPVTAGGGAWRKHLQAALSLSRGGLFLQPAETKLGRVVRLVRDWYSRSSSMFSKARSFIREAGVKVGKVISVVAVTAAPLSVQMVPSIWETVSTMLS